MRARKKKNTPVRLEKCAYYLAETPAQNRGKWLEVFSKHAQGKRFEKLALEIGCGKGDFATGFAARNPEVAFCAMERVLDVLMLAAEMANRAELDNLLFLSENAALLPEFFAEAEVDCLFLNFSDPWPKARHAKRRLTSPVFLEIYRKILKPDAVIAMKTDNVDLFNYSLETLPECGFVVENVTRDLHNSPYNEGNIVTEYERNFSEKGFPIHRLEARLK